MRRLIRAVAPALLTGIAMMLVVAMPAAAADGGYRVHRLVADTGGRAAQTDANLVNGWGLVAGPSTPWWVSDNGTNKSTLYDGTGAVLPLVVDVAGGPTGTVFNGSTGFVVRHRGDSGPSLFLFASEDGKIRGWNPSVPAGASPSTKAFVVADRSGAGAIYKGLAIATKGAKMFLYATDFHNGRIDVFNQSFVRQRWAGAFVDPNLPAGFAPFGIWGDGDELYVTYAKQDANAEDESAGMHLGFVDEFSSDGKFLERVASRGPLNAPWGIAEAPDDFGRFSGDLLIGNFGDGTIHAYRETSSGWKLDGTLKNGSGRPIWIDGLWGMAFGNGGPAGPTNTLFFAAGPNDEEHGLFGSITAR